MKYKYLIALCISVFFSLSARADNSIAVPSSWVNTEGSTLTISAIDSDGQMGCWNGRDPRHGYLLDKGEPPGALAARRGWRPHDGRSRPLRRGRVRSPAGQPDGSQAT